ncbi:MAG: polyprenol monophosphomannose synthase [Deltaproteobacteria bacterium]|nr:MAG: polyprenol monophosphomannose synthase [Deltaproteobacteria bacterium]
MKSVAMIPTFNEAENIQSLIEEIIKVDKQIEVLVVDDDSPDGTAVLVEEISRKYPRVHLIWRKEERGRGKAGIVGFLGALELGADCVIEMDGDFSHHPRYIPHFLKAIQHYDVVIGSRAIPGGEERGRKLSRRLITRFANSYIRWVYHLNIQDCTSGFRCFRRSVLEALPLKKMISRGPSIVEEVLYACHCLGFSFKEIPIIFEDRKYGESNLSLPKLFNTFFMILRFRFAPSWK